ncbi:extracellular solute-binding protein [Adhaeretor mobilis]|uniref:Maltose transport system permease protein MalF n=1 Tax=Adhaeretor mobilis TaxID=1930276 RepID=A0A517N0Z6_9BACT|nr:extracellular solute-binding protein [Adhaeretor mobilis]QDT00806.1 Maltose transport system permease protein MalF [Adhaeretor mobilis]
MLDATRELPANLYRRKPAWRLLAIIGLLITLSGCSKQDDRHVIQLWHQMVVNERLFLNELVTEYEKQHPEIDVRLVFKDTEELRSSFQAAALAGVGPAIVYGPSDVLGAYHTMGIIADMTPWLDENARAKFKPGGLTYLPAKDGPQRDDSQNRDLVQVSDRFGNHLALVYNRKFVETPPQTVEELIEIGRRNTLDEDGNGRNERYGLVWNYEEPYFAVPFITGSGGWLFANEENTEPDLDTPQMVAALQLIDDLQRVHGIVPRGCDYETADSLFKSGNAAMIINGDWSWGDYLALERIDAAIAPLPIVTETGQPMGPMISPKGYSLNKNATPAQRDAAMQLITYLTSESSQRRALHSLRILPSRTALYDDPLLTQDPTLKASREQFEQGHLMPSGSEMRAVWDAMRPPYQAVLGGAISAKDAAAAMQANAEQAISLLQRDDQEIGGSWLWAALASATTLGLLFWQRRGLATLLPDMRRQPLAYLLVGPAIVLIFLTVVFPFFYNLLLSFSNMSLTHFQDWGFAGSQNYIDVLGDGQFYAVLLKTIIWTIVNVVFHVGIGILLAVALNGPIRGKAIYRVLLILPWAVPAYITALTWRSMFHLEYGAVNLLGNQLFGIPPVNWLGEATNAFIACIIANVWLGFPFMMVIALGGLQGIPQDMYEAARIDRASRWQQFRHITLPLLKPVLAPAATLGAIWTFNNLNVVWLVSNGGAPSNKTHILVSYVYKEVFNLYRYGYGAALSMIVFVILLAFCLVFLHRAKATENVYG